MADLYRVLLTEEEYTTADGPIDRSTAMTWFGTWAPGFHPASSLRVVTEDEYQRVWPELDRRNVQLMAAPALVPHAAPGELARNPRVIDGEVTGSWLVRPMLPMLVSSAAMFAMGLAALVQEIVR